MPLSNRGSSLPCATASDPVKNRPASPRPPGAKNYVTPQGARRMREELDRLVQVERPRQAASPVNPEARRQLQVLDQNDAPSSDGRVVASPFAKHEQALNESSS